MMDEETVAAIAEREADATPGPWIKWWDDGCFYLAPTALCYSDPPFGCSEEHWQDEQWGPGLEPIIDHEGQDTWPWAREADMLFAYQARTDVPLLLAERAELKAEVERLSGLLHGGLRTPTDADPPGTVLGYVAFVKGEHQKPLPYREWDDDETGRCSGCGYEMQAVRPGKMQCSVCE